MYQHPYIRDIPEMGVQIQISTCKTQVAFRKFNPYAILETEWKAYWINDRFTLNDIQYMYGQWHSIENNTELKKYLAHLLGYTAGEKDGQ